MCLAALPALVLPVRAQPPASPLPQPRPHGTRVGIDAQTSLRVKKPGYDATGVIGRLQRRDAKIPPPEAIRTTALRRDVVVPQLASEIS